MHHTHCSLHLVLPLSSSAHPQHTLGSQQPANLGLLCPIMYLLVIGWINIPLLCSTVPTSRNRQRQSTYDPSRKYYLVLFRSSLHSTFLYCKCSKPFFAHPISYQGLMALPSAICMTKSNSTAKPCYSTLRQRLLWQIIYKRIIWLVGHRQMPKMDHFAGLTQRHSLQ